MKDEVRGSKCGKYADNSVLRCDALNFSR